MDHDLDQVRIVQHLSSHESGADQVGFFLAEGQEKVLRCVGLLGQLCRQIATHRDLDFPEQLAQDVRHQGAFALGQDFLSFAEEIGDRRE